MNTDKIEIDSKSQESIDPRFLLSDDDLLWIRYGIEPEPGNVPEEKTLWGLLKSPNAFIEAHNIKVFRKAETFIPEGPTHFLDFAKVPKRFFVYFRGIDSRKLEKLGVSGIDQSSILTVRVRRGQRRALATRIPANSKILVTLVQEYERKDLNDPNDRTRGRAYIHWEINPKDSQEPVTAQMILEHVFTLLEKPGNFEDDYKKRLKAVRKRATVKHVDLDGKMFETQPQDTDVIVTYAPSREIIVESEEFAIGRPGPIIISCNVDIGNYYIDPITGQIVIVNDTSIVKIY